MMRLLDANIVGPLCRPAGAEREALALRITSAMARDQGLHTWGLPEIVDYEVRRGLLRMVYSPKVSDDQREHFRKALARLDALGASIRYLPLTTGIMRRAAELWAAARGAGKPTAATHQLDADVILAAQVLDASGLLVTENKKHFGELVPVLDWRDL